jgi:hypothetical protein
LINLACDGLYIYNLYEFFEAVDAAFQYIILIALFQKLSTFDAPFDSDEVGYNDVSNISVLEGIWDVRDVDTKCLCLPRDQTIPNPMPAEVLKVLNRKKVTPAEIGKVLSETYRNCSPSWSISALLVPNKN